MIPPALDKIAMNKSPADVAVLPRWMRSWERFWFTPMDPTPLALIRIACGLIVLYTFVAYSFSLQDQMGIDAWVGLSLREQLFRDRPVVVGPLKGSPGYQSGRTPEQREYLKAYFKKHDLDLRMFGLTAPENDWQRKYLEDYTRKWGQPPPAYAESDAESQMIDLFRIFYRNHLKVLRLKAEGQWEQFEAKCKQLEKEGRSHDQAHLELLKDVHAEENPHVSADPRISGLKAPRDAWQLKYLEEYAAKWGEPPPAYAEDEQQAVEIDAYRVREGLDPRVLYARGSPIWSVWMHITDPVGMAWVQGVFVLAALLFVLGLGTRVSAAATWFASLSYIHRNTQMMFGVDTMINILLLYLMIGPSGAALSLDRLVLRWWRGHDLGPPEPRVSANIAIRLLQIHTCIVYLMAGISKLQGTAWWNGTALWSVMANYEFAPMQFQIYNDILRGIARNQVLFEVLLTASGYFTLMFEVGYCFMIWWPRTRWVYLGGAIMLHGTIGMFMGLKTFSAIMLIMNMAFLRPNEVQWLLRWVRKPVSAPAKPAPALEPVASKIAG
jgi:hypothetical protein